MVLARSDDHNARALVDLLTREKRQMALVQEFLPSVREGDKRVLLLDGRELGTIRRIPQPDDVRANVHVGGRVEATELTPKEQALVDEVGKLTPAVTLADQRRALWGHPRPRLSGPQRDLPCGVVGATLSSEPKAPMSQVGIC